MGLLETILGNKLLGIFLWLDIKQEISWSSGQMCVIAFLVSAPEQSHTREQSVASSQLFTAGYSWWLSLQFMPMKVGVCLSVCCQVAVLI